MKVIHVFNSHVSSGPEKLVIPALAQWHHEVEVINLLDTRAANAAGALKGQDAAALANSMALRGMNIEVHKRWDPHAVQALAEALEAAQPDVVHSHDVKASLYLLKARERSKGRYAIVSTHHGVRGRFGWKIRLYEQLYARWVLPRFDRVLAVCSSDREILIRRGLDPERTLVHVNGVDREVIPWAERAGLQRIIREKWQREGRIPSTDGVFVGIVARLSEGKEHEKALEVLKHLKGQRLKNQSREPVRLLCFGAGALENQLKRSTKRLGLGDDVFWCGYSSDVSSELVGFDLVLSLSKAEGLPVSLLEAGWAATPVFAAGVDGILDLIRPGIEGELVSVNDEISTTSRKLDQLLSDPVRLEFYARSLQQRVRTEFSQKQWLERLDGIYRTLADSPRR